MDAFLLQWSDAIIAFVGAFLISVIVGLLISR